MIDQLGLTGISGTVTNSVGEKSAPPSGTFGQLLSQRAADVTDIDNAMTEIMEHILKSIASMHDGSKNIWDIVLQVEKKADPKVSDEIIDMSYDETAGLNGVAGLLARFWKKKELLEGNDALYSYSREQKALDNKAVSELAALQKKKERQIEKVHE